MAKFEGIIDGTGFIFKHSDGRPYLIKMKVDGPWIFEWVDLLGWVENGKCSTEEMEICRRTRIYATKGSDIHAQAGRLEPEPTVGPIDLNQIRHIIEVLWPGAKNYDVGDIMIGGWFHGGEVDSNFECSLWEGVLFRQLEWWEYRNIEDMPTYLKNENGSVYKVKQHFNDQTRQAFVPEQDGYFVPAGRYYTSYEPATEQEYLDFMKTNPYG